MTRFFVFVFSQTNRVADKSQAIKEAGGMSRSLTEDSPLLPDTQTQLLLSIV